MEQKLRTLAKALAAYAMRHAANEKTSYTANRTHVPHLDFSVTDECKRVHNISFYKSDLVYSSAQHDEPFYYYVECESPALGAKMECCHPEVDRDKYDIESSCDEAALVDVLGLAVRRISQADNTDYISSLFSIRT